MSKSIDSRKIRDDLYSIQDTVNMMVWLIEDCKSPDRVHTWLYNIVSAVSDLKKHCKIKGGNK